MAVPGLLLVSLNLLSVGITLSLLGARYRDVAQMTQSVLHVAIFVTPIFWLPRLVPEGHWILVLNPFVHLLDLVRNLLGEPPELGEIVAGLGCTTGYNLDGGGSSVMIFDGEVVTQPSNGGERATSDILYVAG